MTFRASTPGLGGDRIHAAIAARRTAGHDGGWPGELQPLPEDRLDARPDALGERQPPGRLPCPLVGGRPSCKGDDPTPANYLFLGPKGGHPRRSNCADRFLTPAAEGLHPARNGAHRPVYITAAPWPGIPIPQGNRKATAAEMAEAVWPDLLGKFKPHDDRHTHATWLDAAGLHKVIQTERRGHAMPGMDAVYNHVTPQMHEHLCDVLEELWREAVEARRQLSPGSAVPLLNTIMAVEDRRLAP